MEPTSGLSPYLDRFGYINFGTLVVVGVRNTGSYTIVGGSLVSSISRTGLKVKCKIANCNERQCKIEYSNDVDIYKTNSSTCID
jgi:hypothetical protein